MELLENPRITIRCYFPTNLVQAFFYARRMSFVYGSSGHALGNLRACGFPTFLTFGKIMHRLRSALSKIYFSLVIDELPVFDNVTSKIFIFKMSPIIHLVKKS